MRIWAIFVIVLFAAQTTPQTARDYYNEIYAVGGLDHMADEYACFDEDSTSQNFFIFGQSKTVREFMMREGGFTKLPKDMQAKLKEDWLIVHGYAKGIPFNGEEFYKKDGDTWISPEYQSGKPKNGYLRIRVTVNWQTLRYKRAVETLNPDLMFKSELAHRGRCEKVKPDVRQNAEP